MAKRKLKVEFPEEKRNFREDTSKLQKSPEIFGAPENDKNFLRKPIDVVNKKDKEELEEILEEQVKIPISNIKVSPTLELSENNLEAQIAASPESNSTNKIEEKPLYESIRYTNSSNYQENSYDAVNFSPPDPTLSSNSLEQQDFFRNPIQGFRQANPFNPAGYPGMPEKNYETLNPNENKKKRRM